MSARDISSSGSNMMEKWQSAIEKMTFNELILLEFSSKSNETFRKMFPCTQNSSVKSARCSLCETASITNFPALLQHIQGRKHTAKVKAIVDVYKHPNINPSNFQGIVSNISTDETNTEISKTGESKIVINPLSISAEQIAEGKKIISEKKVLKEFMIKSMTLNDLLLIEYRFVNTNWQKLFKENNNLIICCMCKSSPLSNLTAIKQHMNEKKHQTNIALTRGLYHPKYASTKDDVEISPSNDSSTFEEKDVKNENEDSSPHIKKKQSEFKTANSLIGDKNIPSSSELKSSNLTSKNSPQQTQFVITSKQRSLMNLFRTKMLALNIEDLRKIEYRYSNGTWKKMLLQNSSNQIKCMLCNVIIIQSLSDIKQHIAGKKHQQILDSVALLYHPVLANTKIEETKAPQKSVVLNDQIFRQEIPKLSIDDLKQVEYTSDGTIWKNLMLIIHGTFKCTICNASSISSFNTFLEHLKGKKHNENINLIKKFYHPTKTLKKNEESNDSIPLQRSESQNTIKNNLKSSSMERTKKREGKIVCTIELEDSPEKEIKIEKNDELQSVNLQKNLNVQETNDLQIKTIPPKQVQINQSSFQEKIIVPNPVAFQNNKERQQLKILTSSNQFISHENKTDKVINSNKSQNEPCSTTSSFSTKTFSSKIERDVEGLIGVEYVVKILRNANDSSPRYECCLCEVEVDGVGMQWHLKGLDHRIKFLERHFPTAMMLCAQYKNDPSMSVVMAQIVEKLAIAIEKYHGRDLPYECLYDEFRSNRHGTMSKIFSFKHASELNGPSFTEVIDKKAIDEFVANKATYRNPEFDPKRRTIFDDSCNSSFKIKRQRMDDSPKLDVEEHRKLVEQFLENTKRRQDNRPSTTRRRRSRSKSRSPSSFRRRQRSSRSPRSGNRDYHRYSKRTHSSPIRDGDIWQIYRRQFDRAVEDLENRYEKYRKDPESHPSYDNEWRQFWNRKADELAAEGKNPSTYNFQPDWVKFFTHRINELYEEAVEDIRVNLRKKLGLGLQNSELLDNRYHVGINRSYQHGPHTVVNKQYDHCFSMNQQEINMNPPQVQNVQYMQQAPHMQQMYQMPENPVQTQFYHQMEQMQPPQELSYHMQPPQMHQTTFNDIEMTEPKSYSSMHDCKSRDTLPGSSKQSEKKSIEIHKNAELDVDEITPVSVLRILTALEDQLGSLGPKVIELLSKALTLEKVKPNATEELFTTENCVFLETVREKLKGQLLTGLAESAKIRAVKKAIKDVTTLLDNINENHKNQVPQLPEPPNPPVISNITKPSTSTKPVSSAEKRELASKLATALSAQGRTDFTTKQLEQLVTVYSMINKKTKETSFAATSSSQIENDYQMQPQKSLSDTLADLIKSTNNVSKDRSSSEITQQNKFSNPSKESTLSGSPYSLPKSSFSLSNFDTSLKIDNSNFISGQNIRQDVNQNVSTEMLNKILYNVSQNSKNTNYKSVSGGNQRNFEGSSRFLENNISINTEQRQQSHIPSLFSLNNRIRNQTYEQQQQLSFNDNFNNQRNSNDNSHMISYPSNTRSNQQGNNRTPMGWSGKFGNYNRR